MAVSVDTTLTPPAAKGLAVPPVRRMPLATRLAYGFGTVAFGIKNNGFQTILLLFYNQVVGLPADTVGLVIFAALLLDGLLDPVIGHLSDQTRTRWGRRHPFMYAAALPIGLTYLLLWNPPRGDQTVTLWYLAGIAILVRAAISLYEVPSTALAAELTSDYHERTVLAGYREIFGWLGAMLIQLLLFTVLLRPTPQYPVGQLNPDGYRLYGIVAGMAMTTAILISAAGTHREVRHLPRLGPPRAAGAVFASLGTALRNRTFLVLMGALLLNATNGALTFAMSVYANTYIWEMPAADLAWFTLSVLLGVVMAVTVSGPAAKRWGKRNASVAFQVFYAVLVTLPLLARVVGVFPANGSPLLLPILLTIVTIYASFGIASAILFNSMSSDVVEEDQARTGERREGMFFAVSFFIIKCAGGLGLYLSGLIIGWVDFPTGAKPGAVPIAVLDNLALSYCALSAALGLGGAWLLSRYTISQKDHEARVADLATGAAAFNRVE